MSRTPQDGPPLEDLGIQISLSTHLVPGAVSGADGMAVNPMIPGPPGVDLLVVGAEPPPLDPPEIPGFPKSHQAGH